MRVQIAIMANHFLYLPLYYAHSKGFFGYIDPATHDVEIILASPRSDAGALAMLLSDQPGEQEVHFAVCDAMLIYQRPEEDRARIGVLANLITNAAIWAIDKEAPPATSLGELARFERVICYEEGTTTYGIARRIVAGDTDRIVKVAPGQEFIALARYQNSIALSPDIITAINAARSPGRMQIVLPLASTAEYHDVMVTALLARSDFIGQNKDFTHNLLRALQRALIAVRFELDDIIDFARDRFNESREAITAALAAANAALVFSVNIAVQRTQWASASRASIESRHLEFDESLSEPIAHAYDQLVTPYSVFALTAMKTEIGRHYDIRLTGERPTRATLKPGPIALLCAFCVALGGVLGGFLGIDIILFSAFVLSLFGFSMHFRKRKRMDRRAIVLGSFYLLGLVGAVLAHMRAIPELWASVAAGLLLSVFIQDILTQLGQDT
jgi:hypothetical protein